MDKYICLTNTHTHTELIVSIHRFLDLFYLLVCYVLFVIPGQSSVLSQSVTNNKHSQVPNMLQMFSRCFSFFGFFPCTEFNLLILIAVKLGSTALSHQAFCIVPAFSVNLVKLQSVFSCAPYQFFHYYIIYYTQHRTGIQSTLIYLVEHDR